MRVEWACGVRDEQDAEGLAQGATPGRPAGRQAVPKQPGPSALPTSVGVRRRPFRAC